MDLHQCSICVPAKRNLYLIRYMYIYITWSSNWQRTVTKKKGLTKFHKDHVINSQSIMHHTYLNINLDYECSYNNQNRSSLMLREWTVLVFFKCSFFIPNVHHSFWKLKRILTLIIRMVKGFELMNCFFTTHLSTLVSKMFLTLKIMDFENVTLTKSCSYIYVIKGMNA